MMVFKRPFEECLKLGWSKQAFDEAIAYAKLTNESGADNG